MIKLEARKRDNSSKEFSEILGVVYGHNKENVSVIFNYADFEKVYKEAGTSSVINLEIDGEEYQVIIKDIQIDPRKDRYHHIDFYQITKGQKMEATVSLSFVREAPAEKLGLVLNTAKTEVKVEAMPKDLPSEIEVDLSVLVDEESNIRVKDLKLPEGVVAIDDSEEVVVSVVKANDIDEESDEEVEEVTNDNE